MNKSKKIVAIGGGHNGRINKDGTRNPYETGPMDKEIIRLTNKEKPHFLFIAHSQKDIEVQESYFRVMSDVYNGRYGCECKILRSSELQNKEKVEEIINWSDIIYEGGGDTLSMIKLWKETGFDIILKKAWEDGKVMCGVSAGANCWFKECSTDSLRILYGDDKPLISMECLGFQKGFFVPHCDETDRYESAKRLLKESGGIGLLASNCTALEIIDNKYRIISSNASSHNIEPYFIKMYWQNNKLYEEKIKIDNEFREMEELYERTE